MTDHPDPHPVTIEAWFTSIWGTRYAVVGSDGRTILSFGTEAEARRRCREYGWTVRENDDGMFGAGRASGEADHVG